MLRILLADEHLVVVDKPPGMPSVPARTPLDPPSVATVLAAEYGPLEAAHRLDRDTSGLLLLARSSAARVALGRAFESRAVGKTYLAVVHGEPPVAAGAIHQPLADDPWQPPRKRVDPIHGRRATTRWRTLARHVCPRAGLRTLLALEPVTGRSHQLRVHLAWLGCPIAGDRLYGRHAGADATRLALHAAAIAFPHPVDGRLVRLVAAPDGQPWDSFPIGDSAWHAFESDPHAGTAASGCHVRGQGLP